MYNLQTGFFIVGEDMAFTFLVKGFGGYCLINDVHTFMTSYSLTKQQNWIKSQGITGQHYNIGKFKKLQDKMVRDYPMLDLKLSFDLTKPLLSEFISAIVNNGNHDGTSPFSIGINENNYNYGYTFSEARLTSFSFSVAEGGLAKGSASFLILQENFEVDDLYYSSGNGGEFTKYDDDEKELMAYWGVGASFGNYGDYCTDISFDWSQSYDIKFLLRNQGGEVDEEGEEDKAPDPYRVLWQVPTAKFSLTMLYNDISNSNGDGDDEDNGLENQDFEIKYAGRTVFKCTECYAESITPLIGEKDNYLGYTISGFVNGEITES